MILSSLRTPTIRTVFIHPNSEAMQLITMQHAIQSHQRCAILTRNDFGILIYCCSSTIFLTPTNSTTPLNEAWDALLNDASHHTHTTLVMIPNILQFLPSGTHPASSAVAAAFASFGYRGDGVSNNRYGNLTPPWYNRPDGGDGVLAAADDILNGSQHCDADDDCDEGGVEAPAPVAAANITATPECAANVVATTEHDANVAAANAANTATANAVAVAANTATANAVAVATNTATANAVAANASATPRRTENVEGTTMAAAAVANTNDDLEFAPVVDPAFSHRTYLVDIVLHPQLTLSGVLLVPEEKITKGWIEWLLGYKLAISLHSDYLKHTNRKFVRFACTIMYVLWLKNSHRQKERECVCQDFYQFESFRLLINFQPTVGGPAIRFGPRNFLPILERHPEIKEIEVVWRRKVLSNFCNARHLLNNREFGQVGL